VAAAEQFVSACLRPMQPPTLVYITLYFPAAGASRLITFSVVSSRIFLISCLARFTDSSVGPSISRYSLRSPGGAGFPGGTKLPRVVTAAPVSSLIIAIASLCVTCGSRQSGVSGWPTSLHTLRDQHRKVAAPKCCRCILNLHDTWKGQWAWLRLQVHH
jgi:hypothetical protein